MGKYEKPMIMANEDVSEGIYAASGAGAGDGEDCYSVDAYIHQTPETGRGDYRIQVNGRHAAGDNHHSGLQTLLLFFNQAVTYKSSNGTLVDGDGSECISIDYSYHNNAYDNIGLGDVVVEADSGLAITGSVLICNHDCGQH